MMNNDDSNIVLVKKKYRTVLLEQYAAAYEQLSSSIDQSYHPVINENIKQLEKKIKTLDSEIKAHEFGANEIDENTKSKAYRESFAGWQDNLHRIDFSQVNKYLTDTCAEMEDSEGAALFLIKNSNAMGGKWCVKKIVDRLKILGNWYPSFDYSFSPRPNINHLDFLYDMANRFDVKTDRFDEQSIIKDLIDKIYLALVGGGNVFMIHVDIPSLDAKSVFLNWFVYDFWMLLIRKMSIAKQKSPLVKIFAVITVRGAIHKQCLPDTLLCKKSLFVSDKILEMPLQKWSEKDICKWLIKFSGLMVPEIGMTVADIELMAESIYQITQGRPIDVYDELMNTMTSRVS